jgi:HYR domain
MDTLDGPLPVSCAPASGATFVLGGTTVSCSVSDAAGNGASASFIVTVVDTSAPQLTLPAPIAVDASGATATVTYATPALDVVDGPRTPSCTPASGSTFPVGTTQVRCQATDAHGNVANGSFTVTVSTPAATMPGSMHGAGHIGGLRNGTEFVFHVKQSERADERGWLLLQNRDASGVSSFVSQRVETVTLTNNPSFSAEPLDSIMHQAEPPADTVVFTGIGWWQGRPGYLFEATAEDHGEPGRGHDRITVVVRDARGTVVLSVTGLLNYGNIQSVPAR